MADPMHLVCPHCRAVNRIAAQRLQDAPQCGSCHQALFSGQPTELSGDSFRAHIARNEIPTVVDFWAPWCGPCRMMAPAFASAAKALEPQVRLAKLNTDSDQQLAGELGIRSIPTLMLFKDGKEIDRHSGAIGEADIVRWVRARL